MSFGLIEKGCMGSIQKGTLFQRKSLQTFTEY